VEQKNKKQHGDENSERNPKNNQPRELSKEDVEYITDVI